jgi:hypothetical protein
MDALVIAGMSALRTGTGLAASARPDAPVVPDSVDVPPWRRTRTAVAATLRQVADTVAPRTTAGAATRHRRLAH